MTKLEEAVEHYKEAERAASNAALAVIRIREEEQSQTTFGFLVPQNGPVRRKVMIKPTIGRVVWFHPVYAEPEITHAAIVCHVWSDTCVNLHVIDSNGVSYPKTSVLLYQGDGERPSHNFAEWMPYQQGQAAKTEQLQAQLQEVTR